MKKIMKITTIFAMQLFTIIFVLSSLHVAAQKKAAPEFAIYANGGVSTYCFQPIVKGSISLGYSSDFGIGFTGFFSQQVGIHTSAGFGFFNVKSKLDLYHITPGLYDKNGILFDLHTKLIGYTEIHKTMFVSIPVMLQFQTKQKQYWNWTRTQKAGFYAQAGVKVHLMFNNQYEVNVEQLSNAGYYPEYDNWAATQMFADFGVFDKGYSAAGKLDFGVLVLFASEIGVKWRIDNNLFVYTGAFFDCGLNNPIKDSRQPYGNFIYERDLLNNLTLLNFSDRINLMTAGIKLRIAFSRNQRPY
jgi:hypothetical protein